MKSIYNYWDGDKKYTVAELKKVLQTLEKKFGDDAVIEMDAGYSNVCIYLETKKDIQETKKKVEAIKEEAKKKEKKKNWYSWHV